MQASELETGHAACNCSANHRRSPEDLWVLHGLTVDSPPAHWEAVFITARTGLTGTPTACNASLLRIDHMPIPGMPGRP
jgi:hypothetical protein